MEFQDRILRCVDCGKEFVWTAGEQQFFADKNFKNEPKRCKACKAKRASRPAGAMVARERVETVTNCSNCGKETTVPFRPTQGRKKIVLNLAQVPYIDSAGLGEVVRTFTTVSRQGGQLKLLNLTKKITDLLAITKLLTVFDTYDSEQDAVQSFSASAKA